MLNVYDYIIIFLILYLFTMKINEKMSNTNSCKYEIRKLVKQIYKDDVNHIKNLTEISNMSQNKEGLKPKKGAIIEIKGDIEIPNAKIEVAGRNNYLENLIFIGDKISIQHHSTGRRLIATHDWRGHYFPNNKRSFNKVVHPRNFNYHWTIVKPNK